MTIKQLSSAYADAVLDYLETGIPQGIEYRDGLFLLSGRSDCEGASCLLVGRDWAKVVPRLSVSTNTHDPRFDRVLLRARIIDAMITNKRTQLLLARVVRSSMNSKHSEAQRGGLHGQYDATIVATSNVEATPAANARFSTAPPP